MSTDQPESPSDPQRAPSEPMPFAELVSYLPPRVWYLSTTGQDMWCRGPYTFFFSSSAAAESFAAAMDTGLALVPVGVEGATLLQDEAMDALRSQNVTRVFLDPEHDPASGDVFGRILRLAPLD